MPKTARVLHFPKPVSRRAQLSAAEAEGLAAEYVDTLPSERTEQFLEEHLSNPDVLLALCKALHQERESSPAKVEAEATFLYQWMTENRRRIGLFDEQEYFLGEVAHIAAIASRFLGKRAETERWLDRAESGFRHTINAAPSLARVSYSKLALRYETRQYEDVLELIPSLRLSFGRLGMGVEASKCSLLEAMALNQSGRRAAASEVLESLRDAPDVQTDPALLGQTLVHLGNNYTEEGRFTDAGKVYQQALPLIQASNRPVVFAELKWSIGDTCKAQGHLQQAIDAYRAAQNDFATIGTRTMVALLHLVIAESLLDLARHREAEWEILSALPTIEEQKMAPEGLAAVALLKESVRLRQADPNALRELREHLQKSK
jgi:tetratricopeptide (TPR) repeat protein